LGGPTIGGGGQNFPNRGGKGIHWRKGREVKKRIGSKEGGLLKKEESPGKISVVN